MKKLISAVFSSYNSHSSHPFLDGLYTKIITTTILVVSFLLLPKVGFRHFGAEGFDITHNIIFPLSHANIFHLLCNICCMWQMRRIKDYLLPAFFVSLFCSFLPESTPDIMGCSGVLFAIIGFKYGKFNMGYRMIKNNILFFIITAFIPNVAVLFHIYCLITAFFIGYTLETYRLWQKRICI